VKKEFRPNTQPSSCHRAAQDRAAKTVAHLPTATLKTIIDWSSAPDCHVFPAVETSKLVPGWEENCRFQRTPLLEVLVPLGQSKELICSDSF